MQTKLSNILWPATSFYVTENRPRDTCRIHFVLELQMRTREELHANSIYQLDLHNKRQLPIKTNHNGLRRTRSREAQGRSAPGQCKSPKHSLPSMLILIPPAGENRKRTPKHQLFPRHPRERQQGQHCRHHCCWQERTHHRRHRRREDAHWWPRACQRRDGFQQGC